MSSPRPIDSLSNQELLDAYDNILEVIDTWTSHKEAAVAELLRRHEAGLVATKTNMRRGVLTWSAGRTTYSYSDEVKQAEDAVKTMKKIEVANGTALDKQGPPFWTYRKS